MRLLWAVDHRLQVMSRRMAATMGITGPQRLVVRVAARLPGISASEVAALLHLHKSTLTGVIDRLHQRGLIVLRPDPQDARRVRLALTGAGRRLARPRSGTVEAAVARGLSHLSRAELAAARRALRTMADALEGEVTR